MEIPHVGTTPLKTLDEIALSIEAGSKIVNDPTIRETSQAHLSASSLQEEQGFEVMVHESNLVKSPPIQMEVPIINE